MEDLLLQLGVGGIFAILIIREFVALLQKRSAIRRDDLPPKERMYDSMNKVDELHKWHDVSTPDGNKIWYVPGSLEKGLEKLNENIEHQTKAIYKLTEHIKRMK